MKNYRKHFQTVFAALCVFLFFTPSVYCFEDAIIAVVNNEVITLKDLRDYINSVYTQLKMDGHHSEAEIKEIMGQVEKEGVNRLIDDRLVLSAANKKGVEARRNTVDQKISEIRSRYPSEQIFLSALSADGITITDLRERIADQLKSQFFVEIEIKSTVQISPQEITDYYQANIHQFINPELADLDSIFIPYGENAEAAKERANTAYGQLKIGQDFQQISKQYSTTASIGTVAKGQMKPNVENQIFKLKPGEFTWPIESDQGLFIFKLKKKIPERTIPLNDVKDQITQFLFNQKFKEKMASWLKEARQKNYIEIKNP